MSLYKGLTRASTPVLEAYLARRTARGKEDPARKHERRGKPMLPRGDKPLVWFHAASVGESQALIALIQKLLAAYPQAQVMVTTGTVTSAKLMADRLPAGAFHQYIPVDHPRWTESFLDHWKPDLVIWSESDFWPNMLAGIKKRGIPAVLLNARMSEKSFRHWRFARGFMKGILGTFALCLAQNEAEAARLTALGAPQVRVAGNLKYGAAPLPVDTAVLENLKGFLGNRTLLLWASTHPGEEDVALRLHKALRENLPQLLTIIVPRHPARGAEVAALAQKAGFTPALRSHNDAPTSEIYIADTLGELGLFYRLAPLCIMGGSFAPIGGHNPIEPAQLGCAIFYGPHMFNFTTICHDFESRMAAMPVPHETALQNVMTAALHNPHSFEGMAQAAREWTESQAHIADETLDLLAPYLQTAVRA